LGEFVLGWLKREKKLPGWFAFSIDANRVDFAHGRYAPSTKSQIMTYGTQALNGEKQELSRIADAMRMGRYQCAALLRPGEYQLLLVDAPKVPKEELKSAIRWRIKDMIDYHVDDATIDVLDIPVPDAPSGRNRPMYAVAARNELIESTIRRCEEAEIPLSVIDVQETAQRNIAALYEQEERAVALAYFAEAWGLLTINYRTELYLARRFDTGLEQLAAEGGAGHAASLERLAVEIQRTLDHFDRSFRSIPVASLLLAPAPRETGAAAFLKGRLGIDSQDIDLRDVLAFVGEGPEKQEQWRLFHQFGAALRHESKAL
jgi:MSHA biogenesis protein MshI